MASAVIPARMPAGSHAGPSGEKTSAPRAIARGSGTRAATRPPARSPRREDEWGCSLDTAVARDGSGIRIAYRSRRGYRIVGGGGAKGIGGEET
ncbi:hypothetical protein JCM17961_31150 [Endothiovibrio diazotrophicus]